MEESRLSNNKAYNAMYKLFRWFCVASYFKSRGFCPYVCILHYIKSIPFLVCFMFFSITHNVAYSRTIPMENAVMQSSYLSEQEIRDKFERLRCEIEDNINDYYSFYSDYYWDYLVPEHKGIIKDRLEKLRGGYDVILSIWDQLFSEALHREITENDFERMAEILYEYLWDLEKQIPSIVIYPFYFSCNEGGCIKVGKEIEIRNETREIVFAYCHDDPDLNSFDIAIIPDEGYRITNQNKKVYDSDELAFISYDGHLDVVFEKMPSGKTLMIHVPKEGTLPDLILESEKYTIEELTLTGELNGTDFRLLRDMAGEMDFERTSGILRKLDLSGARVVAGGTYITDWDWNFSMTKNDVLPSRIFVGCKLTSIIMPNSVTTIEEGAFWGCHNLTSITISNSVTSIEESAFAECGLSSVTIPNSVTSIGVQAFAWCNGLTSITIPNSVTIIGDYAFASCSGLPSITIPNSVITIGEGAFNKCYNLTSIITEINNPFEINENVFSPYTYTNATLFVPVGTKTAYQSTAGWNKFKNIVEKEADNIIQGDANGDKEVNVSDIVEVVNFIMDNPSAKFVKVNVDLNGDGEVNVTDIVMMVNIIMSAQYSAARYKDTFEEDPTDGDWLTLTEGGEGTLALNLENRGRYVASQFDLRLSNGQTLESITLNNERLKDHKIIYKQTGDNCYKVIAYSLSNKTFMGESGKLLDIHVACSGEVCIDNILLVTKGCQEKHFGPLNSMTTGINKVTSSEMMDVYAVDGRKVRRKASSTNGVAKGVYIINGKKHIVR